MSVPSEFITQADIVALAQHARAQTAAIRDLQRWSSAPAAAIAAPRFRRERFDRAAVAGNATEFRSIFSGDAAVPR